jgi:hypothetical protein
VSTLLIVVKTHRLYCEYTECSANA